jgi:hypothetical protein
LGKSSTVTTYREKAFIALLVLGVCCAFAALVVSTSGARAGKEIYYEYNGAERLDAGVGHAVPKEAMYWFAGAALLAFASAYLVRER